MSHARTSAILLFDGVCNLCNAVVNGIIDRDPRGEIRFAALQSLEGQALVAEHGREELSRGELGTLVLLEDGRLYERSTAALRVARHLVWPWPLAYGLMMLPKVLRDGAYRFIARHRYGWFGQQTACRVPTPELRARFLP